MSTNVKLNSLLNQSISSSYGLAKTDLQIKIERLEKRIQSWGQQSQKVIAKPAEQNHDYFAYRTTTKFFLPC